MDELYLGIEIGGTKLQLQVCDPSLRMHQHLRYVIDPQQGATGIQQSIEKAIHDTLGNLPIAAAGIGFGGPVDWQQGRIWKSYHVEGWSGFPLAQWLADQLQCPVYLENDANVAALGEACHGAGQEHNPVFYVTMGSGVGGGLVVNRQIYHGTVPGEIEFGHLRLDRSGTTVQSVCSGWAVDEKIRQLAKANPESIVARLVRGQTRAEARWLWQAVQQGDAEARNVFDHVCDTMGWALSHAVHLLHPEIIIIGGGLSLMGEPLRQAIQSRLSLYLMDAFQPGPPVVLAQLQENAVPVGAITLARSHLS